MSTTEFSGDLDLEAVLSEVLRPIEPPESLGTRVEETLSRVAQAAATELSDWADEMSIGETEALGDPRNWVRPVVAAAAGGVAGAALLVFGTRRRRSGRGIAEQVGEQLGERVGELRDRLSSD